jgi:hypothetical protein
MKRIIAICVFFSISIMAFPQKDYLSDGAQKQTQNSSVKHNIVAGSYEGIIELGYACGIGKYGMNNFRLNFINSLRSDPYFSFGLGVGVRYYSNMDDSYSTVNSRVIIPIFLNFQANFLSGEVSPYLALGVGGTVGFESLLMSTRLYKGLFEGVGFLLNPSAGIRFKISEKCAIISGIACEMQKIKLLIYPKPETKKSVGSLSLNFGISF